MTKGYLKKCILGAMSILILTGCVYNPSIEKLNKMAMDQMQSGNYDAAIQKLQAINDLDSTIANNYYNLGIAYSQKEDYENSIKNFRKAIRLNPTYAKSYFSLAVVEENYSITLSNDENKLKDKNKVKQIIDLLTDANKNYSDYITKPKAQDIPTVNQKFAVIKADIEKYSQIYSKL
ncbi:MAG: tetratricopeptide repeat protein [bacterium]